MLLENGSHVNVTAADLRTPLHMRIDKPKALRILLNHGADPYSQDR